MEPVLLVIQGSGFRAWGFFLGFIYVECHEGLGGKMLNIQFPYEKVGALNPYTMDSVL